ncbi:hypothetical protein ARMA_3034 [Ardenticatena maritima]|uniref:Uncharacterized protein n=1 Tax=Ardenticatena maritima TaxID=872965 RepID=A0A0M8KB38_9CHLR|nr:hypothetical protein [Ardenticatena maritima]GAP64611.1 hypothetical protein ARMA_3034 [Ardenticatena maritima]
MTQHTRQIDPIHARRVAERLLQQLGPAPTIFEVLKVQRRIVRVPLRQTPGRLAG